MTALRKDLYNEGAIMEKNSTRFDYVKYDEVASASQAIFKEMFQELEYKVSNLLTQGRAQSLVLTSLEEAYMWIGKSIRDDQIKRNKETQLLEEREDG